MDPSVVPASDDAPEADLLLGPGLTRADFYCGRYRISADVYTGHRRLVELLRDVNRQYLDVRRLRVTALDGQDPTAEYGEGLLTKTEIDWVGIRAEPPRSEARLYGYVKKTPLRAALVLRTCRIEQRLHRHPTGARRTLAWRSSTAAPSDYSALCADQHTLCG